MLFDAHRILGRIPGSSHEFDDEASLLADMDAAGIDEALVTRSRQLLLDPRDEALYRDDAALSSPRLREVPAFMPGHPGLDEARIDALLDGFPVLRCAIWPGHQPVTRATATLWRHLADAGITVAVDAEQFGWDTLERALDQFTGLRLLALATGYRNIARIVSVARASEMVWFETATLISAGSLEWLVDAIGAHRLVFGTGAPYRDTAGPAFLLQQAAISDGDRAAIASGNLRRLVGRA